MTFAYSPPVARSPARTSTPIAQAPSQSWPLPARLHYATAPIQRKTEIKYGDLTNFTFSWGAGPTQQASGDVATAMTASLDPADPKTGTDTSGSNAFNTLFAALQAHTSSTWVRGHLLNHDLGGEAIQNNLFPITSAANTEHSNEVEENIKHWIGNNCHVKYSVIARQDSIPADSPNGSFYCDAQVTSAPPGSKLNGHRILKTIRSIGTATVGSTRFYKNKKKNKYAKRHSSVHHAKHNNVFRDQYTKTKIPKKWRHNTGSSKINNRALKKTYIIPFKKKDWD